MASPTISVRPRVGPTELEFWWQSSPASKWVAVGVADSTTTIFYSEGGITWTSENISSVISGDITKIIYANDTYFICGIGTLAYSYDGHEWTPSTGLSLFDPWFTIEFGKDGNGADLWVGSGVGVTTGDVTTNVVYSLNGIDWVQNTDETMIDVPPLIQIKYGKNEDGTYIWVGSAVSDGNIYTSTNGFSWASSGAPISFSNIENGTDADGIPIWIAGSPIDTGSGNGLYYSRNGTEWEPVSANSGGFIAGSHSIAFGKDVAGNPMWLAGSMAGGKADADVALMSSSDGITWVPMAFPIPEEFRDITISKLYYNTGVWVAVANSDIFYSTNGGETWSLSSISSTIENMTIASITATSAVTNNYVLSTVAAFLAYRSSSTGDGLYYSPDGISWNISEAATAFFAGISINDFAYGRNMWVAASNTTNLIAYSTNGLDWAFATFPILENVVSCNSVAYGDGVWVAACTVLDADNNCLIISNDAKTWRIPATNPVTNGDSECKVVRYGGGKWVVAISDQADSEVRLTYSTDGDTWTDTSGGVFPGGVCNDIAFGNGKWIAVGTQFALNGDTPLMLSSADGIDWSVTTGPYGGGQYTTITYGKDGSGADLWIATASIGSAGAVPAPAMAHSPDGVTWTDDVSGGIAIGGLASSLTYLNGTWICTTNGDTASIYSTDGYTWTQIPDAMFSIAGSSVPAVFLPGSSRSTIIGGLETNTEYQYMIQGYGESYSDPVFFRKVRTSAPPQPVDSVTVVPTVTDSLSLTFSWTVSATDYAYFFAYELRVARAPSEIIYAGTRDISASTITFNGLDPSRGYIFHIQRGNDAGYSAKKTITSAATTIDPLSIPGIALWLDATDPSVSPVADGAAITSWKNKAGNNNAASSKPVIVKTDSLGRYLEFKKSSFSINDTTWEPNQYFTLFVVDMPAYFNTTLIGSVGNDILIRYYNGDDNTGRISVKVAGNTVTPEAVVSGAPVNIWSFSNYGGLNTYLNNALVKLSPTEVFRATSSLQISDSVAPYTGKFREVVMYKGIMSDENRAAITNYLFTKWMPPPSKIAGLPVKNGLILWLDSTDPKTLFSDLSGTTPAIFNSDLDPVPVQLWKDKSGYNNNVTMNSAAELEAYDFYGNGTNVIPLLNTSTSDTTVQTEPILVSDDVTLFMVLVNMAYIPGPVGYTFEHGGLALSVLDGNQVNPISWGLDSNKNNNQYVVPQGVPYIFYGTMKKRQLFNATFLDHTQTATREYTIERGLPGLRYANISLAQNDWPQSYGEIIYYNRVLSDDEILKTATYLTNKWKPLLDTGGTGLPYIPVNPAVTPFLPTSLPKLKVWLDSSDPYSVFKQGDKLTEWKDRRDSSISAVATGSPLVKNGIVLNGDRQYMKLPDGSLPTGPYSYYIVADVKGDTTIINAGSHDVSGTMWVAASQVGGYSFDGIHWASAPFPFPSSIALNITDMIFAGGYWLAVTSFGSDSNSLAYSSNGFSWTMLQTQGTTLSVATDGKRVVIAGSPKPGVLHSSLMYSDDPKSEWNIGSYADTNDIFDTAYSVAYGNGRWYASGYNGSRVMLTSTDGINWELSARISDLITDPTINPIKCIAYGLSASASDSHLWLAVGQPGPGSLLYEGVGTGWVARASLDSIFSLATKIAYGYGIWVAGGAGPNTMAYSTDGTTWQPSPSGNSCILGSCVMLKHSNGFWIASGETDNAGGSVMAYSKEGIEWQPIESGAVFNGGSGGAVRGAAAKPAIHNSSMSIHTTTVQPTYVAIGVKNTGDNRSYVAYSSDGITWKPSSSGASLLNTGLSSPLHALAYGDGQWLAITQGTASAYSYDGNTWYDAGTLPSSRYAVAYGQGKFVVAGRYFLLDNGYAEGIRNIHYRRPGDSGFSTSNTMTIDTVQSLAYGNGIWVAGGFYAWGAHRSGMYASNLAYSYDGITWLESANGNSVFPLNGGTCECLAYGKDASGNDRWLAGGSVTEGAAMAYSPDGNHWTPLTPVIFSTRCAVIAYADGLWVAGGQGDNTIAYSLNGITWFPSSSGNSIFSQTCNALSYSNGKWTADGGISSGSNVSAYSTDGITWTQIGSGNVIVVIKAIVPTSVKPTLITQTIFDNNATDKIRVAGMRNTSTNNIIVSRDGSTWMSVYTTNSNDMNGIGFNGSQWIAVGAAPQGTPGMLISNDGYNWGAYYLPSMTEAYGIAWNGSYWIAVGGGSTVCIAKSIDGYVWDIIDNIFNKTNDVNPQGRAVAWNGSYWIVVGSQANPTDGSARVGCVFKSFDGINWTPGTGIPTSVGQINTVTWMGDHWLIGSDQSSIGDTIYKSYDGIAWGPLAYGSIGTGLFSRCTGITLNGPLGTTVAVGYTILTVSNEPDQHVGKIATWDGITTWIERTHPFTWEITGVSWDGTQFVAVGSSITNSEVTSCIATSPDGITWTRVGENMNYGTLTSITNGLTTTLKKSIINDIITISDPVATDKRSINVLAYGGGGIAYSKDGITWTKALVNPFIAGSVNGIAFNGFWVAVGVDHDSNGLIATSTDGSTWVPTLTQPFDDTISSVAWNGEYWLAGGEGTAKSMDGITWIDVSSNGGNKTQLIPTVTSLVWNGKYWLAAGDSNFVCKSVDGIHWSSPSNIEPLSSTGPVVQITGLAWNGSAWLAVGYRSDFTSVMYVSSNGINWEGVDGEPFWSISPYTYAHGLASNGSIFVAVGENGSVSIATSPDGFNWTVIGNPILAARDVCWNGAYWIVSGEGVDSTGRDIATATSLDGITWTSGLPTPFSPVGANIVASGSIEVPSSNTCIIESINGASYISGQAGNNSVPSRLLQDISNNYIGWDAKDKYMKGTIKEILVYDTAHSDRERRQIETYLTNKWAKATFDPTTIDASAVLWLDSSSASNFTFSSANRISVWKDKMGLCDLLQSALWAQPVYSLDPVTDKYGVQFGGRGFANGLTNAVAPLGDTESLDYSIFVAQRYDYSTSSGQNVATTAYSLDIGEPPFNVGTTSLNQSGVQGELRFSVGYKSGPGIGFAIRNDIFANVDVRKAAVITSQVTNDSAQTFYYNGKSTDTGSFYWSLSPNATLRLGYDGILTPDLSIHMRGYIYEMLIFRGPVSFSDREKIEGYLAWKWGAAGSLPRSHPYTLAPIPPASAPAPLLLDGPTYNMARTLKYDSNFILAWDPVPNATGYRVCFAPKKSKSKIFSPTELEDSSGVRFKKGSTLQPFVASSNIITDTQYVFNANDIGDFQTSQGISAFVFSYNGTTRGHFPKVRAFITPTYVKVYETIRTKLNGGTTFSTSASVTYTNLNTGETVTRTRADILASNAVEVFLGGYIGGKTF